MRTLAGWFALAFGIAAVLGVEYLTNQPAEAQSLLNTPYGVSEAWDCAGGTGCPKPIGIVDGSNTVFPLRRPPIGAAALDTYKNGLHLRPTEYLLSSSGSVWTVTFAAAPAAGDTLDFRYRANVSVTILAQ